MEHNYTLRDVLRQWLRDLEDEIQNNTAAYHTRHLYEFAKFSATYLSELRAMATCLEPIYDLNNQSVEGLSEQEVHELQTNARGRNSKSIPTLAEFFDNEYIFFRDLTDEIETICSEVRNALFHIKDNIV